MSMGELRYAQSADSALAAGGTFPRIWIPSVRERDLRQLLLYRWHLVRMRARVKNQLQHIALFLISRMLCNPLQDSSRHSIFQ
jgi:hypothetical protein